ncbi:hypothetical protein ACWDX6_28745 [Streptomyces sp. NPDC003027]
MRKYRTAVSVGSVVAGLSPALGTVSAPAAAAHRSEATAAATCGGAQDDYVGLTFRGRISQGGRKHQDLEAMFWHRPTQPYLVDVKMASAFSGVTSAAQNSYRTSNVQWWNVAFRSPEHIINGHAIPAYRLFLKARCAEGGTQPTQLEGSTDTNQQVSLTRV